MSAGTESESVKFTLCKGVYMGWAGETRVGVWCVIKTRALLGTLSTLLK